METAGNPMNAVADLDVLPCFGGGGRAESTPWRKRWQKNGLKQASVCAQPPQIILSFLSVKWTRACLLHLTDPSPSQVTITTTSPPPSAHYGNKVLFLTRPASSSFFFAILSPTHHHTSLHVSPAQTISRDFPSNPSPALAGACVSQVLPWKPGWLGTQPELSGTLSWLPLFSSCTPANKEKKKRKNKSKQVFMWKKKVDVLLNVLMCARTNTLLMFPIRAGV